MLLEILLVLGVLFLLLYRYTTKNFGRWEKEGIPTLPGHFPYGSWVEAWTQKRHFSNLAEEYYEKFKSSPVSGLYLLGKPVLSINDVELVRHVMVKDFNHFVDRNDSNLAKVFDGGDSDKYWKNQMNNLNGDDWKDVRSAFSPIFTSGKMKGMVHFILEVGKNLTKEMDSLAVTQEEFELKKVFGKFSLDALANCAFGVNPKSFEDESGYFVKSAARMFQNTGMDALKMITRVIPGGHTIHKALDIGIIKPKETKFFMTVIKETIKQRRETGARRNDIVDLMIDCIKNIDITDANDKLDETQYDKDMKMNHKNKSVLTEDTIVSTAMVLLVAGYDTTGMTLSYLSYFMSMNPDLQRRLQNEIDEAFENNNGKIPDYNTVTELPYLESCILETLRMYTPVGSILRACVKDYKVPGTNVTVKANELILIPSIGIHHDEQFYPNPKQFNPDNFSKEARQSRSPYTFTAFGQGPRACIGMRFALLEMKLALCELLHNFNFLPADRVTQALVFEPQGQLGYAKGGLWAKVERRI